MSVALQNLEFYSEEAGQQQKQDFRQHYPSVYSDVTLASLINKSADADWAAL